MSSTDNVVIVNVSVDDSENGDPIGLNGGGMSSKLIPIDFLTDPEMVRAVVKGELLAYGYLVNPAFVPSYRFSVSR